MKLLIQPEDGIKRLVKGIGKAKKSIEVVIFRFDRPEIERALLEAVENGVFVHALIAFTNHGGEEHLRKLEMRMLERGISVARSAGDLVRYHGKMLVIDRRELYILAFNFTHLDIDQSRSFGLITRNPGLLHEAIKLFEADTKRQPYVAGNPKFIVSPVNARNELTSFVMGAKKELLIYDPEISDREMLRALQERRNAGVDIRVIGKVSRNRLPARTLSGLRVHTRAIIRDGQQAFLGSQSLRQLELDSRREIGVIFRNRTVIGALTRTFEQDWKGAEPIDQEIAATDLEVSKTARKMAKLVSKKIPVDPVIKHVVRAIQRKGEIRPRPREIEESVKTAVKDAVRETVREATKDAIQRMVNKAETHKEELNSNRST